MKKVIKAVAGTVGAIVLFFLWYGISANYDYSALAGTYVLNQAGEICTLSLRPDRTFSQQIDGPSGTRKAEGQWHRYGQSHVSFSSEFLKVTGEEMNASDEAHGQFEKSLGLWPSLTFAPIPGGPTLHRKLFR